MRVVFVGSKSDPRITGECAFLDGIALLRRCEVTRIAGSDALQTEADTQGRRGRRLFDQLVVCEPPECRLFPKECDANLETRLRPIPKERLAGCCRSRRVNIAKQPLWILCRRPPGAETTSRSQWASATALGGCDWGGPEDRRDRNKKDSVHYIREGRIRKKIPNETGLSP